MVRKMDTQRQLYINKDCQKGEDTETEIDTEIFRKTKTQRQSYLNIDCQKDGDTDIEIYE